MNNERAAFVFLLLLTVPHIADARASGRGTATRPVPICENHTRSIDALHPRDRRSDGFRQAEQSGTRSSRMGLFLTHTRAVGTISRWCLRRAIATTRIIL